MRIVQVIDLTGPYVYPPSLACPRSSLTFLFAPSSWQSLCSACSSSSFLLQGTALSTAFFPVPSFHDISILKLTFPSLLLSCFQNSRNHQAPALPSPSPPKKKSRPNELDDQRNPLAEWENDLDVFSYRFETVVAEWKKSRGKLRDLEVSLCLRWRVRNPKRRRTEGRWS